MSNLYPGDKVNPAQAGRLLEEQAARIAEDHRRARNLACPCECNSGGWCGGCGHGGCGGRR